MKLLRAQIIIILLLFFFHLQATAQERPKIGLVLSGGGAKGLAHIGILQAIDSAGLKIDYLTGTSMGSVIGGLYAIGYSGNDIEKIARDLNWNTLLSNKPDYKNISIEEKDEYAKYSIELGLEKLQPQIPSGLIESEELWLTLTQLYSPVYDIKDFSKFNIPFKCIATDLSTGNAVVHSQGEIVTAIRSSMAIPSIFTAVGYDSTKLVDGGIVRNFPVIDVKEMGADYVIGVNLFEGLPDISKLNTAMDIFYQITQYRDAEDLVKEKRLCDLIIEPPLEKYSAGSFSDANDIIAIGKEIGKLYYPFFKKLADSLNAIQHIHYSPDGRLPKSHKLVIDKIEFIGIEKTNKELLQDKLGIEAGASYSIDELNAGFRNAFSTRYYKNVYYQLTPTEKDHANLTCIVKEAPLTQAKVGISYLTFTGFAVIANLTLRDLLFTKSRTMAKFAVGEYFRGFVQHRQAFGKKTNSYFNISYEYDHLPLNLYDESNKRVVYNINKSLFDLNFTKVFTINWSVTAGTNFQNVRYSPEVTPEQISYRGNFTEIFSYIRTESKTINSPNFPTSGHELLAEIGIDYNRSLHISADTTDNYIEGISAKVKGTPELYRLRLKYITYKPLSIRSTLILKMEGAYCINSKDFILDNYFTGGIQYILNQQIPFAGINEGQIITNSTAIAMVGYQYNLLGHLLLLGRVNTSIYNYDNLWSTDKTQSKEAKWINGFSAGIGYDIGALPMEITAMYSPEINAVYSNIKVGFIF
ncbi:patatin-like phospholipase family protein [Cytophaga aurantiaca]|uniref:patatin-like phospholipase family protein n=1 Tax=Cytophaga aurantiaca TaxID=29530 RepID=UPI00035FB1E0|nr:patatin-like phospholipase family protein [Cytophaga aurantiaca]